MPGPWRRPVGGSRPVFLKLLQSTLPVSAFLLGLLSSLSFATPPYGDPNQPYDRLPGTLQTYHVPWARPLAGGKLNVLFILPYCNSREVIETAQRLDLQPTVIMNAGYAVWDQGYWEGSEATPLKGAEATAVLDELAHRRLSLGHRYDAIVLGKVSWIALPDWVRKLILEHVERGAGLVYVSPNRLKPGLNSREESKEPDPEFATLFERGTQPDAAESVLKPLPIDAMPFHRLGSPAEYREIAGVNRLDYAQAPVCVWATRRGKGRVLALDYFDARVSRQGGNSLSPYLKSATGRFDSVAYDSAFALLARAILWASGKEPAIRAEIHLESPTVQRTLTTDPGVARRCWKPSTPEKAIARQHLGEGPQGVARAVLSATFPSRPEQPFSWRYAIRDARGRTLFEKKVPVETAEQRCQQKVALPRLPRGLYLFDLQVLDTTGHVADFASRAFQVEDPQRFIQIQCDKEAYHPGETITGKLTLAQSLGETEQVAVRAMDAWGRTTARAKVVLSQDRAAGVFRLPVHQPLSRLWDIEAEVRRGGEVVDMASTWVGLPDWNFDNYLFMLIFAPTPGMGDWKGDLYGEVIRKYGINAAFTYLIYSYAGQYEANERHHLQSVSYAEHLGEYTGLHQRLDGPPLENRTSCLAELSRMCRHVADTGQPLDPTKFPYRLGFIDANWINGRLKTYQVAARFGSPFFVLTGENYLLGEFESQEYSGFSPLCTQLFGQWCKEQYGGDLARLNAEWGSNVRSWDEVRGILLQEAVEKNQLPRWVDFRHFMRSRVWSQFFIDWTEMMRRSIPQVRTGRCGHDHHDFSRYRDQMDCSKLYIGQVVDSEWREALVPELHQSFSGDRSFLMASQSMIRWTCDLRTPQDSRRWPWKVLFLGLRGFDWERGMTEETLGGEFCFTPDLSEPLPFFKTISGQVQQLQRGIATLTFAARPYRSKVAILWAPYNHYISRLYPFQPNGFSGTWLDNLSVTGGAPSDCLAMLNSLRIRPTVVAPEDLTDRGLQKRGIQALFLPYSKGMSQAEADAIRLFVRQGGLVIADNTPGACSEHGRELKQPRLADLFPALDRRNTVKVGQGVAVYLPGGINGFLDRFEQADYSAAEPVAALLREHAGIVPPIELVDGRGRPRRDTLMPVFSRGSTMLVGLLRASASLGKEPEETEIRLPSRLHLWDLRGHRYWGQSDHFRLRLGWEPQYFALLGVNPGPISLAAERLQVRPGEDLTLDGQVQLPEGAGTESLGQAVHVRVYGPDGREQECYRKNLVFDGPRFRYVLPISHSEPQGRCTIEAEHVLTGAKASASYDVLPAAND